MGQMISEGWLLPSFDPGTGLVMVPWWAAAALAMLVVAAVVVAMFRGGAVTIVAGVVGLAMIALVATIVWVETARVSDRQRGEERHALLARAENLAAQAAAPGSALACLDASAGEAVEAACERTLFASPEAVAEAVAYTAARLSLLVAAVDYSVRQNTSYEGVLPGLRLALESDRFGFVAQVLASRYSCSVDACDALSMFRDPARITANLKDRPYEIIVARYSAGWQSRATRSPVASSERTNPLPAAGFEAPSAASIPAVSIMVPETSTGAVPNGGAASAQAAPPTPPRKPAPARPPRAAVASPHPPSPASPRAPTQLVPAAPPAPPAPPQANSAGTPPAQ